MILTLTVKEDENTRRTWEVDSDTVVSLKPTTSGTLVKVRAGGDTEVMEALEDIGLQCDAGGVVLPTVEG